MKIKLFIKKLHCYLLLFNMAFFFFLLYPGIYYFSRKPERYWGLIKMRRWWAWLSTSFGGIFFSFEFEEPVDWSKTYMICPNHTSNIDTAMISLLVQNNRFCIMGKEELTRNLLTGIYFRTVDLPVDRSSKIASFRAFKTAGERLKNRISMVMFPEGGIVDDYPPKLQEFKNGPFRLAIETQVPVIAVSSLNTWKIVWDDGLKYGTRPGVCRIYVHKPIVTTGLTTADADRLRDEVFNEISAKLAAQN